MKRFTRTPYSSTGARISARASERAYRRSSAIASRRFVPRRISRPSAELKSIDVSAPSAQVTSTGGLYLLNGCARGDDIAERSGRQITMRYLDVRVECQGITTATSPHSLRCIIFMDKQCNGAAATTANVLQVVGSPEATVSPFNLEYRNRFLILWEKIYTFSCDYGGAGVGCDRIAADRVYKPLNHRVTFNAGDAGTVADISTNSLYFMAVSDTATAAQEPFVQFYSRLRFTDE